MRMNLKILFKNNNYKLDEDKKKLKIEIVWNELIYFKYFKNQVNIDEKKIK